MRLTPNLNKGVVHDVVRHLTAAHDAMGDTEQPLNLMLVNRTQRVPLAARTRGKGRLVIESGGGLDDRSF